MARDLPTLLDRWGPPEEFDAAIASTAPGSWFVVYTRPTLGVERSTTLFGRFVTGGAKPANGVK